MLKHDWMRKRDRRTRRLGQDGLPEQDDSLFDDEEPLDAVPGLGEADAGRDAGETALIQEPWPSEVAAAEEASDPGVAAPEDQVASFPDAIAQADAETAEALTPRPENVLADREQEPQSAWDAEDEEEEATISAADEQTTAQKVKNAPAREDARAVVDRLEVPAHTLRDRLEQVLARQAQLPLDIEARQEVSEKAESSPRERRDELVQRLLDPTLNLHEAAVLLGVCRTTVRRYTDRGLLRCFRTPGNQRRFNLSDILDFMERQQRGEI